MEPRNRSRAATMLARLMFRLVVLIVKSLTGPLMLLELPHLISLEANQCLVFFAKLIRQRELITQLRRPQILTHMHQPLLKR